MSTRRRPFDAPRRQPLFANTPIRRWKAVGIWSGERCLKILPLYDSTRSPPDWTNHVLPTEVAVFIKDQRTETMLTPDGRLPRPGEALSCSVFDDLASAKAFAEGLIDRREDLRCDIYDHHGLVRPPQLSIVHPSRRRRRHGRRTARWLTALAVVLVLPTPLLFAWDARHSMLLIYPSFIGVNLILVAARLIITAHALRVEEDRHKNEPTT